MGCTILLGVRTWAADPIPGEWVFYPDGAIPLDYSGARVQSDDSGIIYIASGNKLIYDGGTWGTFPHYPSFLHSRKDYWTSWQEGQMLGWVKTTAGISHWVDGAEIRYPDSSTCLEGNTLSLAGQDAQGRMIVDQRFFYGLGGPSTGVVRFSEGTCDSIALGIKGSDAGVTAYGRDARGNEYFGTRDISDTPMCRGLLRLSSGKLDTLAKNFCVSRILDAGNEILAAGQSGLLSIDLAGKVRTHPTLKGRKLGAINDIRLDKSGVLWIATEGYSVLDGNIGLAAIHGADTVIWSKAEGTFPDYVATSLAEDAAGNVWVGTSESGVAVFARDRKALSIAHGPRLRSKSTSMTSANPWPVDLLGRKAASGPGAGRQPIHDPRP